MIRVTIYEGRMGTAGFRVTGHAGYADQGYDIICASVSVLVVNTINSIEALTEDTCRTEQKDGYISCMFPSVLSDASRLLMDSMILGLRSIADSYGEKYIRLTFKEV